MPAAHADVVLRLSGLSKAYGDLLAVDDLSFDVLRGEVAGFPVGTGAEVCADTSVAVTEFDDTDTPDPGEGFYYLIRGLNTCGVSGYGTDSSDVERTSTACP